MNPHSNLPDFDNLNAAWKTMDMETILPCAHKVQDTNYPVGVCLCDQCVPPPPLPEEPIWDDDNQRFLPLRLQAVADRPKVEEHLNRLERLIPFARPDRLPLLMDKIQSLRKVLAETEEASQSGDAPNLRRALSVVPERALDFAGSFSPSTITLLKTCFDSQSPLMECDTSSSKENLPPVPELPISKDLGTERLPEPSLLGKRSSEEVLTLRKPEELPSNVESIAPKKKRAKKAPPQSNGELSQDKVRREKNGYTYFDPCFGTLKVTDCVGVVPGYLITYKCQDRDNNDVIIERFRLKDVSSCTEIDISRDCAYME